MSTTFVNHLPEYCPVMLVSGASNMGRFDMNSNSVRRVFNMLLCPFQVKSRPSSFNISGPSYKCFLWVATQQTCTLIICKTIENVFFAYTYTVSLRYAKLINLQIALAASLKNKTVRKTVISKVASNSKRDSKRCTCTIYQPLGFISFGEWPLKVNQRFGWFTLRRLEIGR